MPETLEKLRPDRDLQCYFEHPSAIAAFSEASSSGFVVSGAWRQQYDWAVVEWNRDNVFEHPSLRNLPDGDLSGLVLTYEETRTNCIPIDSTLFATVEWPYLRIWAASGGVEQLYKVSLKEHSESVSGSYSNAFADFELHGTLTVGDYVGLAWLGEQYNHAVSSTDTIEGIVQSLADTINALSHTVLAEIIGTKIRLTYVGLGQTTATSKEGHNGNRLGAYGFVSGDRTEVWSPKAQTFAGGASPERWRTTLDFSSLRDINDAVVPTSSIRRMRWTFGADLQTGEFQRSEFSVAISAWEVTGTNRQYHVAGPGSRRIEGATTEIAFSGSWLQARGNFSGGSIRYTQTPGSGVSCTLSVQSIQSLYLGCRYAFNAGIVQKTVDGSSQQFDLNIPGEDVLARLYLGELSAGTHTVTVVHAGAPGDYFYFDFLEAATPATELPVFPVNPTYTLATDWDTDHSIALPPERTAWNIFTLGFHGRVNHYAGALWFYELVRQGHAYASASVTFTGTPVFSASAEIVINRTGLPSSSQTLFHHLNLIGETAEDIAKAFELQINNGSTGIWAEASGSVLTIHSRSMGLDGNNYTISASVSTSPDSGTFNASASGSKFTGGVNGDWRTDLSSIPRVNRAARDWSRSFFTALKGYGIDVTAAFSMELQHGDPSPATGIAQRYPSGNAVQLSTPALQTNFSPASLAFWKQVYLDMATVMQEATVPPYLQFGEVQWWYFPDDGSGLPNHDSYTQAQFLANYGFSIRTIPNGAANPASYPEEAAFLSTLIGSFTTDIMAFVRATYPTCKFEVLYPPDVNEGAFNQAVNYPGSWTPSALECLKTENFSYTLDRNLNKCLTSIRVSASHGFSAQHRSHLVGISDPTTPWLKESKFAEGEGQESVVLFALDQFSLIGYTVPLPVRSRRSLKLAS